MYESCKEEVVRLVRNGEEEEEGKGKTGVERVGWTRSEVETAG